MSATTPSFGIVLPGHLGDIILHSSILKPIREQFPDVELILIGSNPAMQLFGDSPYIDRTVALETLIPNYLKLRKIKMHKLQAHRKNIHWKPSLEVETLIFPYYYLSLIEIVILQAIKWDKLISYTGGPSIDINGTMHAPNQIFPWKLMWEKHVTHAIPVPQNYLSVHVFNHIAEFLKELGCTTRIPDGLNVEIDIKERDVLSIASWKTGFNNQPYGILFPGASFRRELKMWPLERYGDVMRMLGSSGPRCWIVCGAADEAQDCHEVARSLHHACPDIQVRISCGQQLRHVAAALNGARLAVGTDSGGMHMAVAIGTPALSIVSGVMRQLYFPWGDPAIHRAVMYPLECWGCLFNCTQSNVICIDEISAKTVADECLSILQQGKVDNT